MMLSAHSILSTRSTLTRLTLLLSAMLILPGCGCEESATARTASGIHGVVAVETARPFHRDLVRQIDMVATLDPWEEVTLYAKVSGYLRDIRVDRGDRVEKGQVLAGLEIPEMQSRIMRRRADVRLREVTFDRLLAIQHEEPSAVTQQEIDAARIELDSAKARLHELQTMQEYARIVAPFGGLITDRYVHPGALVTAGTESQPTAIVRLVDTSKLRAVIDVPEKDFRFLEVGKKAEIILDAYPGRSFQGTVSRFSGALDRSSRTMRTEVLIPNADGKLVAGMFGRVRIDMKTHRNALAIDPRWMRLGKKHPYVFVVDNAQARRVEIEAGYDDGTVIEVVRGLDGTEPIIVAASGPLSDGTAIRTSQGAKQADGRDTDCGESSADGSGGKCDAK